MNSASTFKDNIRLYTDKRILSIFVFGIVSGLPWVMIGAALSIWLKDSGISRTHIGFAGLIYTAYAINYVWSPLVDRTRPAFFAALGHAKSWIVFCQAITVVCCICVSFFEPQTHAKVIVLIALGIAFASATQDVAIDAFRIKQFKPDDEKGLSAGAAAATAGWWCAFAGLGYIPLMLSDHGWSWPNLYLLLAAISAGLTCLSLLVQEKSSPQTHSHKVSNTPPLATQRSWQSAAQKYRFLVHISGIWLLPLWAIFGSPGAPSYITQHGLYVPSLMLVIAALVILLVHSLSKASSAMSPNDLPPSSLGFSDQLLNMLIKTVVEPLSEFFTRNGTKLALAILIFILIFKLGEAFLGRMSIVFYKDIGYSNSEIATYSKMITMWVTLLCVIPCGLLNARFGLFKGLVISGIAMAAANLLFSLIAITGPRIDLLVVAVVVDGFTAAWGTVAFVSFISSQCNRTFTATQYALLASIGNLGRTSLASNSGLVVDALNGNWALFFALTTLMIIPALILLKLLWPYLEEKMR